MPKKPEGVPLKDKVTWVRARLDAQRADRRAEEKQAADDREKPSEDIEGSPRR